MKMVLRPVRKVDFRKIHAWRNDPRVRKWLFASDRIPWKTHERFWRKRIMQRNRYSYIIQVNGTDCGVVRLDPDGRTGAYAIDIYLDPETQGKGIGARTIAEIKKIAERKRMRLVATVKPGNTASQKIFEKNGFMLRHYEYIL